MNSNIAKCILNTNEELELAIALQGLVRKVVDRRAGRCRSLGRRRLRRRHRLGRTLGLGRRRWGGWGFGLVGHVGSTGR